MKNVAVVTSTRADYGLLFTLLKKIEKSSKLKLHLIATGTHLEKKHGFTIEEIRKAGFTNLTEIDVQLNSSETEFIFASMAQTITKMGQHLKNQLPDILILLGDRFEILVAAQAAMILQIPIAHIHGGELTEGQIDDVIRHSLTKLSHLHFASNETHRKRIIQLGENPARVFNVGAPGLDFIKNHEFLSKIELEKNYQIKINRHLFLVTYHPVTLDIHESRKGIGELIKVMSQIEEATIIWTLPNADPDANYIYELLTDGKMNQFKNIHVYKNLGQMNYLSFMKIATAVVGNSSSGILEAPFFKVPTLNIGTRQKGRLQAQSIVNAEPHYDSIKTGLEIILSELFQKNLKSVVSLYGEGDSTEKMISVLEESDFSKLLAKTFYDVD